MHLAELISLRTQPGAGLLLALTERCPLSCAHCSTSSTMDAPERSSAPLLTLIKTFRPNDRPEVILMSGGEPLLRPALVAELATQSRLSGTRSSLLSGMFFARGRIPLPIRRAISTLDHFSASIDVFHEREVGRAEFFAALTVILDLVPAVSLHVTASDDAYLEDLLPQIRRAFGELVPLLVNQLRPTGRARTFIADPLHEADPGPCDFAAWPLVDYDGAVFACSRQSLVRQHRPDHLILGHASHDPWPVLSARTQRHPLLRSIRLLGPLETARRTGTSICSGVCETCVTIPALPPAAAASDNHLGLPSLAMTSATGPASPPAAATIATGLAAGLGSADLSVVAGGTAATMCGVRDKGLLASSTDTPLESSGLGVQATEGDATATLENSAPCAVTVSAIAEGDAATMAELGLSPGVEAVVQHMLTQLRPHDLARRWGAGKHADLVELGWQQ